MGNLRDIADKIFGDFRVLYFDDSKGKYKYYWMCECINCGEKTSVATANLLNGKTVKCKCNKNYKVPLNIKGYSEDLTGNVYGRLTVDGFHHKEHSHSHWNCTCECGNKTIKSISFFNRSKYLMCDECLHSYTKKEKPSKEKVYLPFEDIAFQTKQNVIDIQNDITVLNETVIIDTKNLEKILSFKRYVSINSSGYPYMNWRGKELFLHRFIVDLPQYFNEETQLISEHINGNRLDCREENLRICHKSKNAINCKIYKTNTSGHKGISWNDKLNKWQVGLQYNKKNHYLGVYSNLDDAIKVRKEAELKYYGEFNRNEEDLYNGQI